MMYPNKRKVLIKTFLATNSDLIDRDINKFREEHEVIAITTNIVMDSRDGLLFHYVVFYYEDTQK
jgi:hypothetical protein